MWKEQEVGRMLRRSSLLIAYLFLAIGAFVAFLYMQSITERVEHEAMVRTTENCEAVNRAKETISAILDRLAEERPDDTPEAAAERQRVRQELDDLLIQNECPPVPPRN